MKIIIMMILNTALNPGIPSKERNLGTNRKYNNIKNRYKSPEIIIGNNKLKKGNF